VKGNKMKEKTQLEIENILKKLARMELEYFRNWLMNHYEIFALGHSIEILIDIIDELEIEHKDIIDFLKTITDHSKWEIDESEFIEEEKSGCYTIWDTQELLEKLSEKESERFINILKEKYPVYNNIDNLTYFELEDSFGKENYPSWEEAFVILKKCNSSNE